MMRFVSLVTTVNLSVVSLVTPTAAEITVPEVTKAIARGISYLKGAQTAHGAWPGYEERYPGGVTSLCTLALIHAGLAIDDRAIQNALDTLRKIKPEKTYSVALQTMVFCLAEPREDRVLIHRNTQWLEATQIKQGPRQGAWGYPGGGGDNSNSQFAILALREAERIGIDVQKKTWQLAKNYWERTQNANGSWGYLPGSPGTASMTCAGLSATVITARQLTEGDASVVNGKVLCCGQQQNNQSLDRGMDWMARNFSVQRNSGGHGTGQTYLYYYLYGLERAGRLTAQRFFGNHDWYREGAEKLIHDQDTLTGYWKGSERPEMAPQIATSMGLLFLAKGRRPVLVAKLKHGPGDDWNHHRSDLNHLTAYTEKRWQRRLTWQVIDVQEAQVEDLLQTPVLFISGRNGFSLSQTQKQTLRDYIDRGGFIFAESCCQGNIFERDFRKTLVEMFPESEYQLRLLHPEHPIWYAEERVAPEHLRPLWGIDYGCRTCVVFCPEDLSCYWELIQRAGGTDWPTHVSEEVNSALAIGINILAYATGRELKTKDAVAAQITPDISTANTSPRGTISIAKLQHPGGCNTAPRALTNLLRIAHDEFQMRISTADQKISITDDQLFDHHLVFMQGRHAFHLTPAERDCLRKFIARGGTLFADAVCGSTTFAISFGQEMKLIFPDNSLQRIAQDDPLLTEAYGGYVITKVERRDPERSDGQEPLRTKQRLVHPELEGISFDGRYRVIFSPYDISCALEDHVSLQCKGYTRKDAARIALNVLLYSLHP